MADAAQEALPTTLAGWLSLLETRHADNSIQLGLERVAKVRAALGEVPEAVVITVGGTNGKGSCCAMLEAIYRAAGYRVGCYSSPHLLRYNERVRINGEEVDDDSLVAAFDRVEAARGDTPLTYFEHGTLAAWEIFCRQQPEVIILEVGLGGRLDAVNVFDGDCALLTNVALDHQDYLGTDREQIGVEKAGIFRQGRPAVFGDPQPPASVLAQAEALGVELWVSGRDFGCEGDPQQWRYWRHAGVPAQGALQRRGGLAYPGLRGANQLLNAAAVMTVIELLRTRAAVSMQAVRQGLMEVELPGRFQVLAGMPRIVLDVAHNPQAAGVLAHNLGGMGYFPRTWAVLGMLDDKDVESVVALLAERVDQWLLADLPAPRGLSATALAERLRQAGVDKPIHCLASVGEAFAAAQREASGNDRIVVFGSFLTVAEALAALQAGRD